MPRSRRAAPVAAAWLALRSCSAAAEGFRSGEAEDSMAAARNAPLLLPATTVVLMPTANAPPDASGAPETAQRRSVVPVL